MATLFENITLSPENLASIRDAVQATLYETQRLTDCMNLQKVKDKDPIAVIGGFDIVGKKGAGCDPTYIEKGIANSMQRWELGDWNIPLKVCYESVKGTIGEYALNNGTAIADLSNTDIMTIYTQMLIKAMESMIWRFAWLGDKDAKNVSAGGKITNGVDTDYYTTCDGLFKRIFAICTAATKQRTTISANEEATYNAQRSKMLEDGYATKLIDTLLMDADSRIVDDENAVLLVTRGLADALTNDVKRTYKTIMPWEAVSEGFDQTKYGGVTIVKVSTWDRLIASGEKSGEKVNLPFRAVFANPRQLMVGTNADALISDLDIWFSKKERRNYIYSTGKIGTAILESDMIHAAY